jgi:intracellular multiplication protein IcmK
MQKLNRSLNRCFLYAGLIALTTISFAEAPPDKAQQALEQLRMLQQKLSNNPASGTKGQPTDNIPIPLAQYIKAPPKPPKENNQPITLNDDEFIENKAFNDMKKSLYPLTPEQLKELHKIQQTNEYAKSSTPGTPPKPTATSQFVNLSPGSTPPVIRLAQGFVSSLVFLDSTGSPWPIAAYDLGDPGAFNIQWDRTGNTLMIQASKLYNYGNLAVRLKGLNTPVMLTLIPGQKAVDYRVDLRIQGFGPQAKNMVMEEGVPPFANDLLLHVLEGVPPPGSQRLAVSGGDARAWLSNERMYVRTNLTVLSPGWLASMTSADGTHAYEMQKSPVLLVSWHGKVMQLKVEGL